MALSTPNKVSNDEIRFYQKDDKYAIMSFFYCKSVCEKRTFHLKQKNISFFSLFYLERAKKSLYYCSSNVRLDKKKATLLSRGLSLITNHNLMKIIRRPKSLC